MKTIGMWHLLTMICMSHIDESSFAARLSQETTIKNPLSIRSRVLHKRISFREADPELNIGHINNAAALENLRTPRPELLAAFPASRRMPQDRLRSFAYSTYDLSAQGVRTVPLAEDCSRRDNGSPVSPCGPQLTTADVSLIDGISLRRIRLADPETGLVFSLVFNYAGAAAFSPFAAAHINKFQDNKVVSSEAVGFGPLGRSQGRGQGQLPLRDWTAFTR